MLGSGIDAAEHAEERGALDQITCTPEAQRLCTSPLIRLSAVQATSTGCASAAQVAVPLLYEVESAQVEHRLEAQVPASFPASAAASR